MKIVDRYLINEYLGNLLFITLSLISLFLIIDFFEKFRMFLSNHATFGQMGSYFFFRLPMIISQILPAAILLASLVTCGYLSRHSEITAMKANGISLYRIAIPILTIAALTAMSRRAWLLPVAAAAHCLGRTGGAVIESFRALAHDAAPDEPLQRPHDALSAILLQHLV